MTSYLTTARPTEPETSHSASCVNKWTDYHVPQTQRISETFSRHRVSVNSKVLLLPAATAALLSEAGIVSPAFVCLSVCLSVRAKTENYSSLEQKLLYFVDMRPWRLNWFSISTLHLVTDIHSPRSNPPES